MQAKRNSSPWGFSARIFRALQNIEADVKIQRCETVKHLDAQGNDIEMHVATNSCLLKFLWIFVDKG